MTPDLSRRHAVLSLGGLGLSTMLPIGGTAQAADIATPGWPVKPITYIVPFTPGGSTDVIGRTLAQKLTDILGQPVIVDNKPGAAGAVGATFAAKAKADGYTLFGGSGPQELASFMKLEISRWAELVKKSGATAT